MRKFGCIIAAAVILVSFASCKDKRKHPSQEFVNITSVELSGGVIDRSGSQITIILPAETFQATSGGNFVKEMDMTGITRAEVKAEDAAMPPNTTIKTVEVR
jgi:hypothetical protein